MEDPVALNVERVANVRRLPLFFLIFVRFPMPANSRSAAGFVSDCLRGVAPWAKNRTCRRAVRRRRLTGTRATTESLEVRSLLTLFVVNTLDDRCGHSPWLCRLPCGITVWSRDCDRHSWPGARNVHCLADLFNGKATEVAQDDESGFHGIFLLKLLECFVQLQHRKVPIIRGNTRSVIICPVGLRDRGLTMPLWFY